jgi:hypothetical protein
MRQEVFIPLAATLVKKLRAAGLQAILIDHRHRRAWDHGAYAVKIKGFKERSDLTAFRSMYGYRAAPSHQADFWLVHSVRFFEELAPIEFLGRVFLGPRDIDGFLTEKYGDWSVPHKVFNNISNPTCRKGENWQEATR